MRFVEDTEGTWTAIQLKAVEAEIEQQKRDWEANRLAQLKREEEAARQLEAEENDLLTFSREDASNQVNKTSSNRSSSGGKVNNNNVTSKEGKKLIHRRVAIVKNAHKGILGKRKGSVSGEDGNKDISRARSRAAMAALASRKAKKMKLVRKSESSPANTTTIRTRRDSVRNINTRPINPRRKRLKRSPSKRTTRTSESKEDKDGGSNATDKSEEVKEVRPTEEFDSECSLDVMIDSNDAPDSDSNQMNNYYSSQDDESGSQSQDDGNNHKATEESKQTDSGAIDGVNSTPRTRSRGSVKINLWTLDDSPIPAVKRHKTGDSFNKGKKNTSGEQRDNKSDVQSHDESSVVEDESTSMVNDTSIAHESSLASELSTTNPVNNEALVVDPEVLETVKELKILVTDVKQMKRAKVLDGFASPQRTPSPKSRKLKKFPPKSANNRTLDSWVSKTPKSAMNNSEHSDSNTNDKSSTPLHHSGRTTRASVKVDGAAAHENGET